MKYIAVKSAAHYRASFGKFAGTMINVDAQAIQTHDFAKLPYQKRRRNFFPVDVGQSVLSSADAGKHRASP
jgi:microcystin degradation protein MlrC